MNDQSLYRQIKDYMKSNKCSKNKLSPGECSALAYMLVTSEEVFDELNLKNYSTSRSGYLRLIPAVSNCRKAILADCKLTTHLCETLCSALKSTNSPLKELDLSNTGLQDSGVKLVTAGLRSSNCVLEILRLSSCNIGRKSCENLGSALQLDSGTELLSAGLKSPHCKLEILRLSGCMITEEGCSALTSALSSNPSHLKELDLTYNHPGESVKLLSARWEDPPCRLETLRADYGGDVWMKPGLKKYSCDVTLDPNTTNTRLFLSEENRKVVEHHGHSSVTKPAATPGKEEARRCRELVKESPSTKAQQTPSRTAVTAQLSGTQPSGAAPVRSVSTKLVETLTE
ncbi:hypothetical protein SRHO_G00188030 [Serrasalmus rhombeus]